MADQKTAKKQGRGIKEVIRKFIVSLKRSPQNIPLLALLVAFFIYSLNLSSIANTTARINSSNMGQCEFAAMLFSILAFVVFLRTFPKRQKANKLMLGLLFLMLILLIFVDVVYIMRIIEAGITIDESLKFIAVAQSIVSLHVIFIIATAVLLVLLPLYSKGLRKINTSIDVEGNENMASIDISEEDE